MTPINGSCLCGKIRYSSQQAPMTVIQCHCKHCQKQSGSAFSINLVYQMQDVLINKQDLARYQDTGDSGRAVYRYFCPTCGSSVVTGNEALSGLGVIKAGTLEDSSGIAPRMSIWECSAQSWVPAVDGIPHCQQEMER